MDPITAVALFALVWKIVDFLKALVNRNWNTVVTQLVVWIAALLVLALARVADVTAGIGLAGITIGDADFASLVVIALMVGSGASALVDVKKAIDGTDSAAQPQLLPGANRTDGVNVNP